ncbi:uncharacterized protein LOC120634776 [Pararge aegeria]|uniref:uncharacterized protein LOC120634776 n=1 Tax=Pararge aegeria TaxID=116150 RepID=UPI0019CF99E5|nr:uncharacterized protein LOC120634776 [Pararge aegeria]
MGKRKTEAREAKILRKIRKLEEKLSNTPARKRIMRLPSSSSSDENNNVSQTKNDILYQALPDSFDALDDVTERRPDIVLSMEDITRPEAAVEIPAVSQIGGADSAVSEIEGNNDLELDGSILSLLGDVPELVTELGPPIHKDIATRWQDILKRGLKEDIKRDLVKLYPIPNNLETLVPPILNPEVKVALAESLVKRDSSIFHKQKQIGLALSALSKSVDSIISDPAKKLHIDTKSKLLRPLSDACRILCDVYQLETKRRRMLILSSINQKMKDIVMDTLPEKYLFGDNMSEKLKTAQGINRSGQILKVIPKTSFLSKNATSTTSVPKSLNQRTPYRKIAARSYMGKQRLQDRAAPAPTPAPAQGRQRHYRRSPPPPPRRQRQQRF